MKRWKSMRLERQEKLVKEVSGIDLDAEMENCTEKGWGRVRFRNSLIKEVGKKWDKIANKYNSLHKAAYREYLKSPEWEERRQAVLLRDKHICRICESGENLRVHHLTYDRKFNEPLYDLVTVCDTCHKLIHA